MIIKQLTRILLVIAVLGAIYIFANNFNTFYQHFTQQAQSFLQGKTDIPAPDHDFVFRNGKYYWPQGPFPSVLLMPGVAVFGPNFHQGVMQTVLIFFLGFFTFKLAKQKKFGYEDTLFLTAVYFLGSTLSGILVDPKSWFFAQIVAVTFLTALLYEFETRRRFWIIGILEGALIATRPTAGFIIFFLLYFIFREKNNTKTKTIQLFSLLLPVALSLVSLGFLNYSNFGSPLDNGYGTNDIGGFLEPLREMGVFSLRHIPTNIYYYFLESVDPVKTVSAHLGFPFIKYNGWGLSFFLTSPFFIYAFKNFRKHPGLWVIILMALFNLLTYYAPGWVQFGPRYTADFIPILFLLLLYSLAPKLSAAQKLIISLSCFFNIYLLFTGQFFPTT